MVLDNGFDFFLLGVRAMLTDVECGAERGGNYLERDATASAGCKVLRALIRDQ